MTQELSGLGLVACDVDGTLLRSDGTLSDRTRAEVAALTVPFVFVTGRPRRWVDRIASHLDVGGAAIAANGALTYDLRSGRTVRAVTLAPDDMRACASAIRAVLPDALFGVERDREFLRETGYPLRSAEAPPAESAFDEMVGEPALKLLCRSGSVEVADELYDVARAACAGYPVELTHSSGTVGLLEIAAAGVDKAAALAAYAHDLGIASDGVVAFGDGFNDVPMIAWAGRGIAVANAHPAVIAVADEVTASNDDDGVALGLHRFGATLDA